MYRQTSWKLKKKKKKGNPVITSHSSCCEATGTYWKLLNLLMVPSASPPQQQPRFHPRHRGGFRSPLWWVPPSLAEGNQGDCMSTANVSRRWRKYFLLGLEEAFSSVFYLERGLLGPPDMAEVDIFSFNRLISRLMLIIPLAPGYTTCSM